jgi:hypothetical protein
LWRVVDFNFAVEPIPADTGGAYRKVMAEIVVDARTSKDEQLHSMFYEVLSAYMDPNEERRDFFLEVADTLMDAMHTVEAANG